MDSGLSIFKYNHVAIAMNVFQWDYYEWISNVVLVTDNKCPDF